MEKTPNSSAPMLRLVNGPAGRDYGSSSAMRDVRRYFVRSAAACAVSVYRIWGPSNSNGCLDETVYRIWRSNGCLDETVYRIWKSDGSLSNYRYIRNSRETSLRPYGIIRTAVYSIAAIRKVFCETPTCCLSSVSYSPGTVDTVILFWRRSLCAPT
jgi:hypothetical protein